MTKELKMNAIPMTEDAASTVQDTNKLEYVNLMEYLPLRYPPTLEEEKNRRIVSNFKRGRCSPELKNQFTDAIKQLKEETQGREAESLFHAGHHCRQDSPPLLTTGNCHRDRNRHTK